VRSSQVAAGLSGRAGQIRPVPVVLRLFGDPV
jgi:hypothetical protein